MDPTDQEFALKSLAYRERILTYIKRANAGHTGGSLSYVDIPSVIYSGILRVNPNTFTDPIAIP